MHSNLMGPAGLGPKFQTRCSSLLLQRLIDGPFVDAPERARWPTRIVTNLLTWPMGGFGILDQGRLDRTLISGRRMFHQGDVPLAYDALLELL